MNDEELKKMVAEWGYTGSEFEKALRMCRDVERITRQRYFSFMNRANSVAESLAVTERELDLLAWNNDNASRESGVLMGRPLVEVDAVPATSMNGITSFFGKITQEAAERVMNPERDKTSDNCQ